jgi:GNAT superfamily N-acetyltransferase
MQISRSLAKLVAPFAELSTEMLLERRLTDPLPQARASVPVSVRLADESDLDRIVEIYASDPYLYIGSPVAYADRLQRGETCFLAMAGDEIAHVNWVCFSWGDAIPGHPIRLRPHEIYTTDGYTADRYRGQGLHAMVLRMMLIFARDRGRTHAYTLSRTDLTHSHKGLLQLGWLPRGRITYLLPRGRNRPLILWRSGNVEPLLRDAPASG